jgi:GTP-binding protein
MEIQSTEFVSSYPKESLCPKDGRAEFAFIGRSNVGKSSLINMLTAKKGLAKVSGTPGKTQLINFFLINQYWYLVDLPGYGYARVSKEKQKSLASLINGYLFNRGQMLLAFVLIDVNINPPSKVDLDFINSLGEHGVPFTIIFTKADRIKPGAMERHIADFQTKLLETWETMPPYFVSSSERRTGRQEILDYIGDIVKRNKKSS